MKITIYLSESRAHIAVRRRRKRQLHVTDERMKTRKNNAGIFLEISRIEGAIHKLRLHNHEGLHDGQIRELEKKLVQVKRSS